MKKLLIIADEYGFFTESIKANTLPNSVDVRKLVEYLENQYKEKIQIQVSDFYQIALEPFEKYRGYYVIYASSDDIGLFYKDYIEDILLRLVAAGAALIPDFNLFRAHHNKVYMELYKTSFLKEEAGIETYTFSSFNSLKKHIQFFDQKYPVVVKTASGAGSCGVGLANNKVELLKIAKRFSKRKYRDNYATFYRSRMMQIVKNQYRRFMKKRLTYYKPMQGKFIVQSFVKGLNNDYKVLVFGEKYYILKRLNRENDFRASGSGRFIFPDNLSEIENILEYAQRVYKNLNVPCASLDVAYDGERCHLIEYQCVNFGPYTLEASKFYFVKSKGNWIKQDGTSELEKEYANALVYYWDKNSSVI